MTQRPKDEHKQEQEQEQEQQPAPEEEPDHPGWLSLAEIFQRKDHFFEKGMFLIGYHFSSNIYVLEGDYATIVDPGNDYTGFVELFKAGLNPADIRKIILTHGHRDHAMGTFELLRYPSIMENKNLEIICHQEGPPEFKKLIKQAGHSLTELKGGEVLDLGGFDWEVIHTPGHTIDSITLYHGSTRTAITGDTVLPHAMADMDKNAGGRLDHYLYGVKALLRKDIENILPGHGVPVVSDGRTAVEQTYEGLMMKVIGVEGETPWIDGAMKLAEKGLLEEAVYCCDRELGRRPEDLKTLQLKALCLNDLGRCQESIEVLDKILAQQSQNAHALAAKGHALLGLERYEESLKYFDEALNIDPSLREGQVFKGMALYLSGRYDEAMDIETFRKEFTERFGEELSRRSGQQQDPHGGR